MAYTQQTWIDEPATSTPLSAARLGHMETGIGANDTKLTNLGIINVKDYGAKGDGTTDDTAAIQAALTAAATGGLVIVPAGSYKLTAALQVPSKVTFAGAGRGVTTLTQTTSGQAVVVSKSYPAANGITPSGYTHINGFTMVGASGSTAHGIVLRDYYSSITEVEVYGCGGDGFRITAADDGGSNVTGNLVENYFDHLSATSCGGWGFWNKSGGGKLTDAFLGYMTVNGSGSTGGIAIDDAAGWIINHVHIYGGFSSVGISIAAAYNTWLHSAYVEPGWSQYGIAAYGTQRALMLGDLSVSCNNVASQQALHLEKSSSLNPNDGSLVRSLSVVQDNNMAVTGVSWDSTTAYLRVGVLNLCGAYPGQITGTGGFGSGHITVAAGP